MCRVEHDQLGYLHFPNVKSVVRSISIYLFQSLFLIGILLKVDHLVTDRSIDLEFCARRKSCLRVRRVEGIRPSKKVYAPFCLHQKEFFGERKIKEKLKNIQGLHATGTPWPSDILHEKLTFETFGAGYRIKKTGMMVKNWKIASGCDGVNDKILEFQNDLSLSCRFLFKNLVASAGSKLRFCAD